MQLTPCETVRLDKWLWAARFYKTRALATEAINGGHVHLNGSRPKPSRPLKVGDRLTIRRGQDVFEVEVLALSDKRGPAALAQQLYREDDRSRQLRERQAEERRLQAAAESRPAKRPDKKGRRQIIRFTSRGG